VSEQLQVELLQSETNQDVSVANITTASDNTSTVAAAAAEATSSNGVDQMDHIDAALSELEKMLNDEVPSSSSSPAAAAAAADVVVDNHSRHQSTVDCLQIPRLFSRLYYVR